jgi:hypothetical protein
MIIVAHPELTGYAPPSERWHAYDDDTYDGAPDAGPQVVGHGATEYAAIADFWRQVAEHHEEQAAEIQAVIDLLDKLDSPSGESGARA